MMEFIKANYKNMSKKEMANILGLRYNQLDWEMRKMNVRRYHSTKYTDYEIQFIIKNYPNKGSKYCANTLNRSVNAINKKIKKLGLEISWKYQYVDGNGYLRNCEDRKNRYLVHRKIMEDYLGRELHSYEIVHHKDGNKLNNNINNLELTNRKEHINTHRKDLNGQHKI